MISSSWSPAGSTLPKFRSQERRPSSNGRSMAAGSSCSRGAAFTVAVRLPRAPLYTERAGYQPRPKTFSLLPDAAPGGSVPGYGVPSRILTSPDFEESDGHGRDPPAWPGAGGLGGVATAAPAPPKAAARPRTR